MTALDRALWREREKGRPTGAVGDGLEGKGQRKWISYCGLYASYMGLSLSLYVNRINYRAVICCEVVATRAGKSLTFSL